MPAARGKGRHLAARLSLGVRPLSKQKTTVRDPHLDDMIQAE